MTNCYSPRLLECISEYSLYASHCWWRMSIITNLFFSWCIYSPSSYLLMACTNGRKLAKSRSQTLFRSTMKLGTYNKQANQQSNWPILNSLWKKFSQHYAPPPPERKPVDTQVLDNIADKYRDNALTMLSRGFFNRQERCYAHLAKQERWEAVQASKNAPKATDGDWHEEEEGCEFILPSNPKQGWKRHERRHAIRQREFPTVARG